jgi:hypothetical protein
MLKVYLKLQTCYDGVATVTITAEGGTLPLSYTFHGETNNTNIYI